MASPAFGIADIQIRHVWDCLDSLQEAPTAKVKHLNILKAFFPV
ncbi:hypothetical protein WKK05_22570 [Nostoc sp. UHCC 0302]